MAKGVISLDDKDIQELKIIVMDKDRDEALKFLKDKIQSQIISREKKNFENSWLQRRGLAKVIGKFYGQSLS